MRNTNSFWLKMKMGSQPVLPYAQIMQELSQMSILYILPNVLWPYGAPPFLPSVSSVFSELFGAN